MTTRYYIPTGIKWNSEWHADEKARLDGAVFAAVRRAIENSAEVPDIAATDFELEPNTAALFSGDCSQPQRGTYSLPSYDQGGAATEIPVEEVPPADESAAVSSARVPWTDERLTDHIRRTFGTVAPSGQTHYGLQTTEGLFFVDEVVDHEPRFKAFTMVDFERDVRGHWEQTGTERRHPRGRYVLRVTGEADRDEGPYPNVAVVTDLDGRPAGRRIYTQLPVGFQIAFDVAESLPQQASVSGVLPGGPAALILFQCHPRWDTRPLTDPAYAGMSDDDLYRLFINLCNARAIENLDLSENYVRAELLPRYTSPGGAVNARTRNSLHNIQHLQEDLRILRGLMLALNRLQHEIDAINAELDPLILTHHRSSRQFVAPLGFGAPMTAETFWPTYHPAREEDRRRVEELLDQLREKGEAVKTVMTGILVLVRRDPFLTQFVRGLEFSGNFADAPDHNAIEAALADVESPQEVQRQIMQKLNEILSSIARARAKLCREPERILDVPLVYTQFLQSLQGINPRFERVAREGIERHQRLQAWTDIGLGVAGLVLFVGGLIVSLAGGPAGVIAFLELSGTALGMVMAVRSIDRASFLTDLADATVEYGRGMITTEAARDARFWAAIDAVLAAVDVGLIGIRAARSAIAARRAEALTELSRGAERFAESVEAGQRIPFDELVNRAAPRGQLLLNANELERLQGLGSRATQTVGRIAEEVAERTIAQSGEYVRLATKVGSNQGIDLLFLRRRIFERVFGRAANPSATFAQATEAQQRELLRLLRRSGNAEDLVSIEVKFSRAGAPVEELLSAARGGVQQNDVWYRNLLLAMRRGSPEVQATGRLLEEIVGSGAQNIDRLARVGISMDARGSFILTRLSEPIINLANQSKVLYQSRRYHNLIAALLEAERRGDAARSLTLRTLVGRINDQINALDAAVRQARLAEATARRAQEFLQRAVPILAQVEELRIARQTPAVISALQVANASVRSYLEAAKYAIEQADADYLHANQIINDAQVWQPDFEAAITDAIGE